MSIYITIIRSLLDRPDSTVAREDARSVVERYDANKKLLTLRIVVDDCPEEPGWDCYHAARTYGDLRWEMGDFITQTDSGVWVCIPADSVLMDKQTWRDAAKANPRYDPDRHGKNPLKLWQEDAERCAQEWLAWADGEVYGFTLDDANGEHVDSCFGFYGPDPSYMFDTVRDNMPEGARIVAVRNDAYIDVPSDLEPSDEEEE